MQPKTDSIVDIANSLSDPTELTEEQLNQI